jgi:hypothetical protein
LSCFGAAQLLRLLKSSLPVGLVDPQDYIAIFIAGAFLLFSSYLFRNPSRM